VNNHRCNKVLIFKDMRTYMRTVHIYIHILYAEFIYMAFIGGKVLTAHIQVMQKYTCDHAYTQVRIQSCIHAPTHTIMHTCTYAYNHAYMHLRIHTCTYAYAYPPRSQEHRRREKECIRAHMHDIHAHVYIRTHITPTCACKAKFRERIQNIHTFTHAHTLTRHTYTHTRAHAHTRTKHTYTHIRIQNIHTRTHAYKTYIHAHTRTKHTYTHIRIQKIHARSHTYKTYIQAHTHTNHAHAYKTYIHAHTRTKPTYAHKSCIHAHIPQGLNGTDGADGREGIAAGDVRVFGGSSLPTDLTCHFPFWHAGKTYTRCTTHGSTQVRGFVCVCVCVCVVYV
jgi:hypothetical protein